MMVCCRHELFDLCYLFGSMMNLYSLCSQICNIAGMTNGKLLHFLNNVMWINGLFMLNN